MADPVWQDNVTPLNAANMTKLQTRDEKGLASGYLGIDANGNASIPGYFSSAATGAVAYATAQGGDTANRYLVDYLGKITWGPGNAPGDTTLYRSAAGTLETDGQLFAKGQIAANLGTAFVVQLDPSGKLVFDADTSLYRYAAGWLVTDGKLAAGWKSAAPGNAEIGAYVQGDGWARASIDSDATLRFGPGNAGSDTNLYRASAGQLKTDNSLYVIGQVGAHWTGGAWGLQSILAPGVGWLYAADTSLYRSAAGVLRTPGEIDIVGGLYAYFRGSDWALNVTSSGVNVQGALTVNGVPVGAGGGPVVTGKINADGTLAFSSAGSGMTSARKAGQATGIYTVTWGSGKAITNLVAVASVAIGTIGSVSISQVSSTQIEITCGQPAGGNAAYLDAPIQFALFDNAHT